MNISGFAGAAEKAAHSYRPMICEFCGSETLSGGGIAFCSYCESLIGSEAKDLERSNPDLFSSLGSIRTAAAKGDYDGAAVTYDQLVKVRETPQLLYAKGVMYIEYSNMVVEQISYGGDGFMDRNSELRTRGSLLISEAKRLIAKSLSMSEKEAKETQSPNVFYRIFLCELKMGDLMAARHRAKRIADLSKDGIIAMYADVVLDVQGGLYKEAERELERIIKAENPPANAFYYAAFSAFKLGDAKGAERIIKAAGALIENPKRANLLEAISETT